MSTQGFLVIMVRVHSHPLYFFNKLKMIEKLPTKYYPKNDEVDFLLILTAIDEYFLKLNEVIDELNKQRIEIEELKNKNIVNFEVTDALPAHTFAPPINATDGIYNLKC